MIANRFFEGGIKFAEFDELFERIMEVAANYGELIVLEGACGHDFFFFFFLWRERGREKWKVELDVLRGGRERGGIGREE